MDNEPAEQVAQGVAEGVGAVADGVAGVAEAGVKALVDSAKALWSVLDAAVEKKAPTDYLSQGAIQAIQGVNQT